MAPRKTFIFKKEGGSLPSSTFILSSSEKIAQKEGKIRIHKAKIEKEDNPLPLDREKISSNLFCLPWIEPEKIKRESPLSTDLLPPREEERKIFFSPSSLVNLSFPANKNEPLPSPALPLSPWTTFIDKSHPLLPLPELSSFDEYLKTVLKIIKKNKNYPPGARKRGEEGKVRVSFTLLRSGKVKDVKLITPSRYSELNKATERLIRELSPFPPFPAEVEKKKITLIMEVIYELKENF